MEWNLFLVAFITSYGDYGENSNIPYGHYGDTENYGYSVTNSEYGGKYGSGYGGGTSRALRLEARGIRHRLQQRCQQDYNA